jgi:opacity protein-like surface antigen
MRKNLMIKSLVVALCAVAPVTARAQELVPHAGSQAVGFDIGAFLPSSHTGDQLNNAPPVSGFYEYYVTPRVSLRGSAGWARPSITGSSIDRVRMMPLRFDVNYNWERGKWHPFVGTGVGSYFLQYRRRDEPLGDAVTRFGVNAGGGIEFFFNQTVALKGEGRYHSVADFGRVDPSGVTLTAGLKTYF